MECVKCRKSFVFYTKIHFYYHPEKADCLNGKKHKWKLQNTFPKKFTKMECEFCGITRELTDKEREKFKILF